MRRIAMTIIVTLTALATSAQAQSAAEQLKAGIDAYDAGKYQLAISKLSVAVLGKKNLSTNQQATAHLMRGRAHKALAIQQMRGEDKRVAALAVQRLRTAADDFLAVLSLDAPPRQADAKKELTQLYNFLLRPGVQYMNASFSAAGEQKALFEKESLAYLDRAVAIHEATGRTDAMPYDLRGQLYTGMVQDLAKQRGDFENVSDAEHDLAQKALADLDKARSLVDAHPPAQPDLLIGYTGYRSAMLLTYHVKKPFPKGAISAIKFADALVDREWSRWEKRQAQLKPGTLASLKQQRDQIKDALDKFRLDIYLQFPEQLDASIAEFEKSVEKEPKNATLRLALGSLYEARMARHEKAGDATAAAADRQRAMAAYKKAADLAPSKVSPWYSLAAMHINRSLTYYKQANELDDFDKMKPLQDKGDAEMAKARPYFEKVIALDPTDREAVRQLMQITIRQNDMAGYKKYKAMKEKLERGG